MKKIILLLVTMLSVFSCSNEKTKENLAATGEYYTCSMDPQVMEYKPGNCPICKMPLTKVKKNMGLMADEIELSDQQIQLGNIHAEPVVAHAMSGKNTISAVIKTNETLINSITAKIMGRIDKLYYKNPGDFIKQGDPVFEIYSEDLNVMKQEYLLTLKNQKDAPGTSIDFKQTVQAARSKLVLYGLTDRQITRLETDPPSDLTVFYSPFSGYISSIAAGEGQYVMLGQEIMRLADLSSLWVEAQAFNTGISSAKVGNKVLVSFPGTEIPATQGDIEFINPVSSAGSRLTQFRAKIDNRENRLKPGMIAYIDLLGKQSDVLSIPENAVIRNAKENLVWKKTGRNKFKLVHVELGDEVNGYIEIRSGLLMNDEIVVTGAYLINSEYIFKKGAGSMEGMDM